MEENVMSEAVSQPQERPSDTSSGQIRIPIKFNKESRELSLEEASSYAQKGMKYDLIRPDFERLRRLAQQRGKSLPDLVDALCNEDRDSRKAKLLEQCGGNEELAQHVMELEEAADPREDSFDELRENFPEFTTPQAVPEAVRAAAAQKGTRLLDEYLRYRLQQNRQRRNAEADRRHADESAVGSQKRYAVGVDPVQAEFLRGIWGR